MSDDYEYRGLIAEAWDLLRGDTSAWPDRAFYRALIDRRGGPVLDVGCGTGRLLLDYLADGVDIDGVDNSPDMLDLCRRRAAELSLDVAGRLFEQTMDRLDLSRTYGVILVPSSSFQLLTDPDAADAALRRFLTHLEPGGVLVISIMSKVWPGRRTPAHLQWTDWFKIAEKARPSDGLVIRRWTRAMYDLDAQLEHEENRYQLLDGETVVREELHARSPALRWYSQAQAQAALQRAGFGEVSATSGFTFDLAAPEDTTFCVIGARLT